MQEVGRSLENASVSLIDHRAGRCDTVAPDRLFATGDFFCSMKSGVCSLCLGCLYI